MINDDRIFAWIQRDAARGQRVELERELADLYRTYADDPTDEQILKSIELTTFWVERFAAMEVEMGIKLELRYTKTVEDLPDLIRGTEHAAGIDLYNAGEAVTLCPGEQRVLDCGVAVEIPHGYFGLILVRSGLGFREGLQSHPGVVDSDFRGPLKVKLFYPSTMAEVTQVVGYGHTKTRSLTIAKHERFAQLILVPHLPMIPVEVDSLPPTSRGEGGYGSTGR